MGCAALRWGASQNIAYCVRDGRRSALEPITPHTIKQRLHRVAASGNPHVPSHTAPTVAEFPAGIAQQVSEVAGNRPLRRRTSSRPSRGRRVHLRPRVLGSRAAAACIGCVLSGHQDWTIPSCKGIRRIYAPRTKMSLLVRESGSTPNTLISELIPVCHASKPAYRRFIHF